MLCLNGIKTGTKNYKWQSMIIHGYYCSWVSNGYGINIVREQNWIAVLTYLLDAYLLRNRSPFSLLIYCLRYFWICWCLHSCSFVYECVITVIRYSLVLLQPPARMILINTNSLYLIYSVSRYFKHNIYRVIHLYFKERVPIPIIFWSYYMLYLNVSWFYST